MKNLKLLFVIYQVISIMIYYPLPADAACSIRTLKNVCNICEERAAKKLTTDSADSPRQQEITCPTASFGCIQIDSFQPLLKENYTVIGMLGEGRKDAVFKLNVIKNETSQGMFVYEIRYRNFQIAVQNNTGFIFYDVINFNLPYETQDNILSFNCIGSIDINSVLQGSCSTISKDQNNNPVTYRFPFIATPDTSPIQ